MRVEELMTELPATCGPDETLSEAVRKMQGGNCAFLPVTASESSARLMGLITDGDIDMASQLPGRSLVELRVRDAMARQVRVCDPEDSPFEAEAVMLEAGLHYLLVVDEAGRMLGVLSLADVAYQAEREREALSARITAAQLGLSVSGVPGSCRSGRSARVAGPARVPAPSGRRQVAAS